MSEDFSNVDYDFPDPDPDVIMYCTNPKCRNEYGAYEINEWDTNAHYLNDEAYTCPECGEEGTEEKPNFEEEENNEEISNSGGSSLPEV